MKTMLKMFLVILFSLNFASAATNIETIKVLASEKGFEPSTIKVDANKEVILAVTRNTDSTCAKEILIPSKKLKQELPLNKTVFIKLGKLKKGQVSFSCGMDMFTGVINVQ
ncbi:MAG: cupredoxin domain-containing protein [Bacteriovorax sp.]|nr:cupredoxin domain-containing protein [Bacteriovorax sp.]